MRTQRTLFLLALGAFALVLGPTYAEHMMWFFSTASQGTILQGQWIVAIAYVSTFIAIAYFLRPSEKGHDAWKKGVGVYSTFIIALFAEMFGFPLTLYLLSIFTGSQAPAAPAQVATHFTILGLSYSIMWTTLLAMAFSVLCAALMVYSWKLVFKSKRLVTTGPYSLVRHPQYSAVIALTVVWAISWPTLTTLLLAPVVTFIYYRLSCDEEKRMCKEFPKYAAYAKKVPMLVP